MHSKNEATMPPAESTPSVLSQIRPMNNFEQCHSRKYPHTTPQKGF